MQDIMDNDTFVPRIKAVHIDDEYLAWLSELKTRYRKEQVKAAVKVNSEKLLWNWQMGRDLVRRKVEERWGTGIVKQVCHDLQEAFPGEKGFGVTNLWYMKRWYLFFTKDESSEKIHQLGEELYLSVNQPFEKPHQLGEEIKELAEEFPFPPIFSYVPWRHHVEIISRCKSVEEAFYYIYKTIEGNWGRDYLIERIVNKEYHNTNIVINNFDNILPAPQSKLAKELIKNDLDSYFVTLPENYDERMLEEELYKHLTKFLLELGTGFAFIGRQKEIIVSGVERKIDLLLYHIRLRSYIVLEIKAKAFEPEFAGKLNFYVNAVDMLLKTPGDNPTIGLLICSDMRTTDVQLSFGGITTPLEVAKYHNIQKLQAQLPTIEQLKQQIKVIEEEIKRRSTESE